MSAGTVVLYAPALKTSLGLPPAMPHASQTGACPGARHGLKRQMSSYEPGVALWFAVHHFLSR